MRVVNIVLNNFTNDSRVLKTTRSLQSFGFTVLVVAIHRKGLNQFESIDGVNVNRLKLASSNWLKIKSFDFFKIIEFSLKFVKRYRKSDVLHCNDLNALLVGVLCKATNWRIRIVYDSNEYQAERSGLRKTDKKIVKLIEGFLIRFSSHVICVSDSIANEYARIYRIPKPHIMLNCPNYIKQPKHNLFRENLKIREDQIIFLYQGGLSTDRGIELLLESFARLETDDNVLVLMGYGSLESLVKKSAALSKNIFFHEAVPPRDLLNYTSSADYGISFIEDTCLSYRYCLPNKIFEYLMAGLPILTSNLIEMKKVVEYEGVGVAAEENTTKSFKGAVAELLQKDHETLNSNIKKTRRKYCWEEQEKILFNIYEDILYK